VKEEIVYLNHFGLGGGVEDHDPLVRLDDPAISPLPWNAADQ